MLWRGNVTEAKDILHSFMGGTLGVGCSKETKLRCWRRVRQGGDSEDVNASASSKIEVGRDAELASFQTSPEAQTKKLNLL